MNVKVLSPVLDGIKDSFRLSVGIVLAVGSVMSAFADHSLSLRNTSNRVGHGDVVSRHDDTNSNRAV